MNLGINENRVKGNFFSNSTINEDSMQLSYFFLPEYKSIYSLNFNISKYLPFIESTLKFSSNYSIYNFKNIVNNSSLRENTNKGLNLNLFAKTAFLAFLIFKMIFLIPVHYQKITQIILFSTMHSSTILLKQLYHQQINCFQKYHIISFLQV